MSQNKHTDSDKEYQDRRRALFSRATVSTVAVLITAVILKDLSEQPSLNDSSRASRSDRIDSKSDQSAKTTIRRPCQTTNAYWSDCWGERNFGWGAYVGEWSNNALHGNGEFAWDPYQIACDLSYFQGEFRNSVPYEGLFWKKQGIGWWSSRSSTAIESKWSELTETTRRGCWFL